MMAVDNIAAKVITLVATVVLVLYLLNQARKPSKFLGRFFVWTMNRSHSDLTDWGLKAVRVEKNFTILDVGCGGGRTLEKLLAMAPEGHLHGVDYATGSVDASRAHNAEAVRACRMEIHHASVSELPFPDSTFDLVTAVETQYYWPDLPHDMGEIRRVLKPGGTLVVILESYRGPRVDPVENAAMKLLRAKRLSVSEQRDLFAAAGYADVDVREDAVRGWLCVTGRRPA